MLKWRLPSRWSTVRAKPVVTHAWLAGYSGWLGVLTSGVHVGSGTVAGFPSVSPARIAVYGRQAEYVYLPSKQAMYASAATRFTSARARAAWTRSIPVLATAPRMPSLYCASGRPRPQNSAVAVWAGLRTALVADP